jgi:hypothetical protein
MASGHIRERVPLDWAMTQNNLGTALLTLGQRENSTERLLEAVEAYRDALEKWTRERAPLQWATTQNNLGTALSTLGNVSDRGQCRRFGKPLSRHPPLYRLRWRHWTPGHC